MGKGSNTTTTSQNQTYAPAGAGYIQNALNTAQNAANLPFNIPQAPVAGFTGQQQQAFGLAGNTGIQNPYLQQAQNYFQQGAQPNISQFFNPQASAVTAQLNNIFGQQQQQTTGQLTQAAGGVGADRIAVGQSELANQQGLSAGQTLAGLYTTAGNQALQEQSAQQGAGYGIAGLGGQAQQANINDVNTLLGSGGLQQQLAQAQLNSPYQQQLAQAAFPYQQANFLAGITGSLAPGLGGTSYGTGQTTAPAPSIWSQILGGGAAATGALGASGAFGNNGWITGGQGLFGNNPSYGGGSPWSGDAYGGSGSNPLPGLTSQDYGIATGGRVNPYAEGGAAGDAPINPESWMSAPDIPQAQIPRIQTQMPQLNLNPPQQSQGSGGGGAGQLLQTGLKLAAMFDTGGTVPREQMRRFDGFNPQSFFKHRFPQGYDDGGSTPFADHFPAERFPGWTSAIQNGAEDEALFGTPQGASPEATAKAAAAYPSGTPFNPMRMDPQATQAWRDGTDAIQGTPEGVPGSASALPPAATPTSGQGAPGGLPTPPSSDASPTPPSPSSGHGKESSFIDSPWAALMAAGLGIMGGTSPFAGVNIGQGGMQGLKTLQEQKASAQKQESIDQAAERLAQEAKFHEDQYTRSTPYQEFEMKKPVQIGKDIWGKPVMGVLDQKSGNWVDPGTHQPIDPSKLTQMSDEAIESGAQAIAHYQQPPVSPYKATTEVGSKMMDRARQIAQDEGRLYNADYYHEASGTRAKFASGAEAASVRSFNTSYRHLDLLDQAIDAMNNGSWKTANALKNSIKTEFGLSAAPTDFEAIKNIAMDEVTKAVIGARGALGDRETNQATMDKATSPAILRDVLRRIYKPAMIDQLQSFKQQYTAGTHGGKQSEQEFGAKLQPEVREALEAKEQQDATARQQRQQGQAQHSPDTVKAEAKQLIAQHPEKRNAIIQRMKEQGYDPSGL